MFSDYSSLVRPPAWSSARMANLNCSGSHIKTLPRSISWRKITLGPLRISFFFLPPQWGYCSCDGCFLLLPVLTDGTRFAPSFASGPKLEKNFLYPSLWNRAHYRFPPLVYRDSSTEPFPPHWDTVFRDSIPRRDTIMKKRKICTISFSIRRRWRKMVASFFAACLLGRRDSLLVLSLSSLFTHYSCLARSNGHYFALALQGASASELSCTSSRVDVKNTGRNLRQCAWDVDCFETPLFSLSFFRRSNYRRDASKKDCFWATL